MVSNTKENIGNKAFRGKEEYAYGKIDAFNEIYGCILELYNKVVSYDMKKKD